MRNVLILLVFAVACSRRAPEPAATPVRTQPTATRPAARAPTTTPARTVVGSYRFTAVNKNRVPAEFPAGSGARLESGSLELQPDNRFAMRFVARASGAADTKSSGESGRYRIGRDTLYFYVDGRDTQPPVTFRFVRTSEGLRLIDSRGNTWAYARQ
jgi:hypothetical protein